MCIAMDASDCVGGAAECLPCCAMRDAYAWSSALLPNAGFVASCTMETPDMYRALAAIWWAGIWNGPSPPDRTSRRVWAGALHGSGFERDVNDSAWRP